MSGKDFTIKQRKLCAPYNKAEIKVKSPSENKPSSSCLAENVHQNINNVNFDASIFFENHLKPSSSHFKSPYVVEDGSSEKYFCPECKLNFSSEIRLKHYQIFNNTSVLLCTNQNCSYPFNTPGEKLSIKNNHDVLDMLENISTDVQLDFDSFDHSQFRNQYIEPLLKSFSNLSSNFEKLQNGDYRNQDDEDDSTGSVPIDSDLYAKITKILSTDVKNEGDIGMIAEIKDNSKNVVEPILENLGDHKFENDYEKSILSQIESSNMQEDILKHFY